MADILRARLDRLEELSKQVNARTDDTTRIVQGVESYLTDVLHLGVRAEITIESEYDDESQWRAEKELVYGRYGPKFRIFIVESTTIQGTPDDYKERLWANCPRDVKVLAFRFLPALLDELVSSLERTLEDISTYTEMIQALLPSVKEAKA